MQRAQNMDTGTRAQTGRQKILLNHTAWLTDNITNAAQKLLKKANPADVTCGLTMNFDEEHIESSYRFHTQGMDTGSLYRLLGWNMQRCKHLTARIWVYPRLPKAKLWLSSSLKDQPLKSPSWMSKYSLGIWLRPLLHCIHHHNGTWRKSRVLTFRSKEDEGLLNPVPWAPARQCFQWWKERALGQKWKLLRKYRYTVFVELPNLIWIECSSCKEWYMHHPVMCVKVPPKYWAKKDLVALPQMYKVAVCMRLRLVYYKLFCLP